MDVTPGSGGGDALDIAWAIDPGNGLPAELDGFDFLRITVGINFVDPLFGEGSSEIDAVAELNGRYLTDGSHEIFLSPGVQFVAEHWLIEASLQLPVVRAMAAGRAETDYRLVLGLRLRW